MELDMDSGCNFNIVPYDQSAIIKTPELINVNYACQDFLSLKVRLRDLIRERFGEDFNDFVESSLAIMLIENWAFCADLLSFKIDQIANEIFIDTVSELDNAFRLSGLVGFKPTPPIAARSLWSATINTVQETDLVINTPLVIDIATEEGPTSIELFPADSTNAPIFDDPIIIPAGKFTNTSIIGIEGRTRTQTNTGSGQTNQFYRLAYGPVIWDSVRISVDGIAWNKVDYFTDSQPRREFRVEYDANYNGYVMFGNNRAGLSPSNGSQIQITYRTGGGVSGNIVTGSVEIQRNFPISGFNFRVPATFRNYTRGEFGYNGDTLEDVKRKLPAYLRMQDRIVSSGDYYTFVNQFTTAYHGMIGKATAVVRNYGCAANLIDVYILARDGISGLQTANNDLKVSLQDAINEKKMMTDIICIKDGEIVEVDVSIDIVMDKFYRKFEEEYKIKILNKINSFFSLNRWEYNQDLYNIDLVKEVADIKEIKTMLINFVTDDEANSGDRVSVKYYQIIRPQNLTVNFVYE
jgi:hypothetical protein